MANDYNNQKLAGNLMLKKVHFVQSLAILMVALLSMQAVTAHEEAEDNSWWWDNAWWKDGTISAVKTYPTEVSWSSYDSNGVDVPMMVVRPKQKGKFPAVYFQHGRRGLDDLVQRLAIRIAAQGFVVAAPDIYKAHFIGTHPIEHDYELEKDVNNGLDILLARKDISSNKACLYSHTRGGYYTLKVATTFKRQDKDVACYVSYYPHLQDPNAPEPAQVYGYAPEVDLMTIPMLVFIGDQEQYQRRRVIETGIEALRKKGHDARVIVYPGVGRGFDFRPENVRTFADDLASKDAVQRAATFIRKHLSK